MTFFFFKMLIGKKIRKHSDYKQFCEVTFFECLVSFSESLKLYLIFSKSQLLPPVCIFLFGFTDILFVTNLGQMNQYFSLFLSHLSSSVTFIAFAFSFEVWFFLLSVFVFVSFCFSSWEMTHILQRLNLSVYQCLTFTLHLAASCPTSIPSGLIGDWNCGIFK